MKTIYQELIWYQQGLFLGDKMTCSQDKCKSVFVTWVWLIGVLVTLSTPMLIFAFKSGAKVASNEQKIEYVQKRLDKIDNIDKKIDDILKAVK
jgi:hypothetical protein